jgi:MFS family permease
MVIIAGALVLAVFGWHQASRRGGEPLIPLAIFRDRNFSVMNFVGAAVGFTMLGLFLPLVIFLQSVLGLTALQAGLTVAPMSLVSMVIAPFAGRMADRIGGKYILTAGLSCFALGMGIVIASAHVDTTRLSLLPGLVVAGLGLGMTFAPLQTVAMRNIEPRMAGAASGLINTSRQVGAVIGSAAVGALLQHELARSLTKAANENAGQLPEAMRQPFISGFRASATGGLQIGSQTGVKAPPGLPQQAIEQLTKVATLTFHQGFTSAMRATLILPIAVLVVAALSCLLVKRRRRDTGRLAAEVDAPADAAAGAPARTSSSGSRATTGLTADSPT